MIVSNASAHATVADQCGQARNDVRHSPGDVDARHRLWQWLAIEGDWKRAWEQAGVTLQLLGDSPSSVAAFRAAIEAEIVRSEVFSGQRPMVLSDDSPAWVHTLAQALQCDAGAEHARAHDLRSQALEDATACSGFVEDERDAHTPFQWLCDGDSRLGPVCELIVQGKYEWLPMAAIDSWRQARPVGLTDLLWRPVSITLRDGQSVAGLMPARYPLMRDALGEPDDAILLGRRTSWQEVGIECFAGVGQKMLLSDSAEHAMLDLRLVQFEGADV